MALEISRVVSPISHMEIWNASSNAASFVIRYGSSSGAGLHGRTGFVASWPPIDQSRCAVVGSQALTGSYRSLSFQFPESTDYGI
jgi:hypothetical protein